MNKNQHMQKYSALHGMRNPMDSWSKSDSSFLQVKNESGIEVVEDWFIGKNDKDLSLRLQKAGPEHCKHLRMIQVWADITAPRYWWIEFDTYRAGVEKVSCSTMHMLTSRPLSVGDFPGVDMPLSMLSQTVDNINNLMTAYKNATDLENRTSLWRSIIQLLPQSYMQKRTVMMSYAALRNIYRQRIGHKLVEWKQFRDWAADLPESWMIIE